MSLVDTNWLQENIDKVIISNVLDQFYELKISIKSYGDFENDVPISMYNGKKLVGKALISKEKSQKEIVFTIPKTDFHGFVSIEDNSLEYDNSFYFSISKPQKSNVIAVGNSTKNNFLSRIYTPEEFNFTATELNTLKDVLISKGSLMTTITFPKPEDADAFLDLYLDLLN